MAHFSVNTTLFVTLKRINMALVAKLTIQLWDQ
jgi:hypothetical protein